MKLCYCVAAPPPWGQIARVQPSADERASCHHRHDLSSESYRHELRMLPSETRPCKDPTFGSRRDGMTQGKTSVPFCPKRATESWKSNSGPIRRHLSSSSSSSSQLPPMPSMFWWMVMKADRRLGDGPRRGNAASKKEKLGSSSRIFGAAILIRALRMVMETCKTGRGRRS